MMNYKSCADFLKKEDNYLILSHKNPDGDTMGSCAALCSALRRLGKTAYLYPNPDVIRKLRPYVEKYYAGADFDAEHVISVDIATEGLFALGFEGSVELCIDHHPTNSRYAKKLLLKAEKASCGEIVLELVKVLCGDITKEEADLLYIAVSTDTGCFMYANTKPDTHRAAAKLMEYGADCMVLNQIFFRKKTAARLRLEGMIFSSMNFYRDGKIAVVKITQDMLKKAGASNDDLDDIAGLAGMAEKSLVNITIREKADGSSKVSLRSGKDVNSSKICAVFGGGGHDMAAGCTISTSPEKAEKMLLEVINEVWK